MATRKTTKKAKTAKKKPTPAQVGHQITFVLMGQLKRARLQFLYIGELLVGVRDRKLYLEMGHPDMADYGFKRLRLGRSVLYRYMNVYDWVKASHPEWLAKPVKGFVPELSDIDDLMWIEKQIKSKKLSAQNRKELEALKKKGLAGQLTEQEMEEWRGKRKNKDTVAVYYGKLRTFRTRCARIVGMPAEVIAYLDAAIQVLKNRQTLTDSGLDVSEKG